MHVYTLQIFGNEMEHSAYIHEKYSTQILCVKKHSVLNINSLEN